MRFTLHVERYGFDSHSPHLIWDVIMDEQEILAIYMAQSENVRYLNKVIEGIQKDINLDIRKSNDFQVKVKTKLFSLLYSAWSEAQFTQIVFTEKGFMYSEICKIKAHKDKHGITEGWKFMINLALSKVGDIKTNADLKRRLDTLLSLIKDYIEEPSILRNRIAHGQWVNALNRENTSTNKDISKKLDELDPVEIGKRIEIHRYLGFIVRDLVQSPKAGFHKHYWTNIVNLEKYLNDTKSWSLKSKKLFLSKKPIQYKQKGNG